VNHSLVFHHHIFKRNHIKSKNSSNIVKCPRCGQSQFGLGLMECQDCHKKVCSDCYHYENGVGLCQDCRPKVIDKYRKEIMVNSGNICPACGSEGHLEIISFHLFRKHDSRYDSLEQVYSGPIDYKYLLKCTSCSFIQDAKNMSLLSIAQKAEKAGRYEDAAQVYEQLNLLDKARKLRELNRTGTIKNVNLDLNALIEQLRQGALVMPYKCPNCGGSIRIDKDYNKGMKSCAYCGSPINTEIVASFLRNL